jgi:hypothetical protein
MAFSFSTNVSFPEFDYLVYMSNYPLGLVATLGLVILVKVLWTEHISAMKDHSSPLPLPPGTYGLPVIGETFSFLMKVRHLPFSCKRFTEAMTQYNIDYIYIYIYLRVRKG